MDNTYNYINIREVLSRVLRNPLLSSVTLEAAILYTVDFIGLFNIPSMYSTKEALIDINDYRGILPCDLISISAVKENKTGIALRSITDNFIPNATNKSYGYNLYTYKCLNRIIFTGFLNGLIQVSYKAVEIDEDGFPMLIDDANFLKTLEAYIKMEIYSIKYDMNEISLGALLNAQTLYHLRAALLQEKYNTPSIAEMESLKNQWCYLLLTNKNFYNNFSTIGKLEFLRKY